VQTTALISSPQPAAQARSYKRVQECAWQELNLLPFGPEPNALSGELQARAGSPV
jgi:hypothetical protein